MLAPAPVPLSKSKVMAGLQCLKRLYFQVHNPDLAESADESQYARLEQGREVGLLAQERFPGGRAVSFAHGIGGALAETAALSDNESVPAIYEATFRNGNVLVRVDILERMSGNRWRIVEVKSSLDLKSHYLQDIAIQHHVAVASGLNVAAACILHLNREYRYDGREYDLGALFKGGDVTTLIGEFEAALPARLAGQQAALARDLPPEINPGPHCSAPYGCEFFRRCNSEPPQNHISCLPRLSEKKRGELDELRIALIQEIPEDFPLTETQTRVRTAVITGRPWISDTLHRELGELPWPRYFMDFESLYPAIPRFVGMRPYSQIPFQWSVHRQIAPDAMLEHMEFLHENEADPRPAFIAKLIYALGTEGVIVVYNAGFESQRLRELAGWLPEYGARIEGILARLWDLLPFIRRHVYHPKFNGSYSIKAVLPALVPDMTYEGMEIADGAAAGLGWERMVRGGLDEAERQRSSEALRAYCCKDTLAMVQLLAELKTTTQQAGAGQ